MKKSVLLAMFLAFAFMACKKEKDIVHNPPTTKVAPSLKKNPAFPNMIMIGAKTDTVVASFYVNPNDANAMTTTGPSSISFIYSGAFKPSTGYKNIYFTVTGPGILPFTSEIKTNVIDAEDYFNQWSRSFASNTGYLLQVHAEVTTLATDGAGAEDKCNVVFKMVYQSDGSSVNKTLIDTGQTITFSRIASSTLSFTSQNWGPGYLFIPGQTFEAMKLDFTSTGGISTINRMDFRILGGLNQNIGDGISQINIYDGPTVVGTGTFSSRIASVVFTLGVTPLTTKTLSFRLVVGQVTDLTSAVVGPEDTKFTLTQVNYTDAGGIPKVLTGTEGMKFTLLKAQQTITSIPLGGTIQNGVATDAYKFKIESVGASTATKQFALQFNLTDNGPNLDSLYFKNLYCKVNGVLTNVRFTNTTDQIIDSIPRGNTKVYITFVTGAGELITPLGSPNEIVVGGKFGGFNHSSNGDNASIILSNDVVPPIFSGFRYVNSGVAPNNLTAKIYTSPIANAGAVLSDYVWSELSATGHSFVFGAGSMDAKGVLGVTFVVNQQVWTQ